MMILPSKCVTANYWKLMLFTYRSGGPLEVILIQTPYNKDFFELSLPMGVQQDVNGQPFAWVIVDWRGFYGSAGAAAGSGNRGEDGYDICEWIVAQTWHGDRIGTWGPSALGKVQYDTAEEHHPNHTCAVPLVAHPQFSYNDYFYGGVLEESRLQQLDALGYGLSPIILANVYYNNTWLFAENTSWNPDLLEIPTLQIGGWYDHNIDKMMDWYAATRTNAAISIQDEQWLLVGPWVHGGTGAAYVGSSLQGELSYPNAEFKSDDMAWSFFNYYLLDAP
jgi:predicted acyl esterase